MAVITRQFLADEEESQDNRESQEHNVIPKEVLSKRETKLHRFKIKDG